MNLTNLPTLPDLHVAVTCPNCEGTVVVTYTQVIDAEDNASIRMSPHFEHVCP